ncbi:MAG TPA: tetratricopeptide repeat protein, partial [Rubrobacteraceae bacterium]|nr:tetratricopeptide repeat protein [Rubrobacteraceae bacterium]
LLSIVLAFFFVASFIFVGLGTNVSYNLFDLIGGDDKQAGEQTTNPQDQIQKAEKQLEEHPNDPDAIKELSALYYQSGQYEDAARVLQDGREVAPKDPEIPFLLGQVYYKEAQATPGKEQDKLYQQAGDAFAAAAEIDPENEDAYLLAGDSYDRAGEPALAIKYYNGYLDLEPEGKQSKAVKERISTLLEGGEETTSG